MHWLTDNGSAPTDIMVMPGEFVVFESAVIRALSENNRFWFSTLNRWSTSCTMSRYIEDWTHTLWPLYLLHVAINIIRIWMWLHNSAKAWCFIIYGFSSLSLATSSSLLSSCSAAGWRTYQCEIFLHIITHYYLLEFDFLTLFSVVPASLR